MIDESVFSESVRPFSAASPSNGCRHCFDRFASQLKYSYKVIKGYKDLFVCLGHPPFKKKAATTELADKNIVEIDCAFINREMAEAPVI